MTASASNRSYWEKEVFSRKSDLVIVGAGITGLSAALFFRKMYPEAAITILEKGLQPEGASTRNAGFACVGSIGEHLADLSQSSESEVKMRIQNRFKGLQLLRSTLNHEAIDYDPCEGFELFTSRVIFKETYESIDRFNGWMEEITGEKDVYTAEELNNYNVIRNRLEGALHPGKLMRELIGKAEMRDIKILWNSRIIAINEDRSLEMASGNHLSAAKILIAANGFTEKLLPGPGIKPARGYVFITEEIENLDWKGIFHHDRGYIYFRNVGNRLLLGGARNLAIEDEQTDEFGINVQIKEHLRNFADEILHLPSGWEIDTEWSGIMGFTETKTPIIRKVSSGIYVAAGLSGMGIAIGMKVGQDAAEMLTET